MPASRGGHVRDLAADAAKKIAFLEVEPEPLVESTRLVERLCANGHHRARDSADARGAIELPEGDSCAETAPVAATGPHPPAAGDGGIDDFRARVQLPRRTRPSVRLVPDS